MILAEVLVRITATKIASNKESWEEFKTNNKDLVNDAHQVLMCYYTKNLLVSLEIKSNFIEHGRVNW
jgi:hypothetical protein